MNTGARTSTKFKIKAGVYLKPVLAMMEKTKEKSKRFWELFYADEQVITAESKELP